MKLFVNLTRALVVALLMLSTHAFTQQVQLEQEVFEIARDLRCPVCISESVADSSAQVAIEMREIIQQQLEEGKSRREILAYFQTSYGDWILLNPPKRGLHLLVWVLPVVVAVVALVVLGLLVRRWLALSRERIDVDEAELSRVRQALNQES